VRTTSSGRRAGSLLASALLALPLTAVLALPASAASGPPGDAGRSASAPGQERRADGSSASEASAPAERSADPAPQAPAERKAEPAPAPAPTKAQGQGQAKGQAKGKAERTEHAGTSGTSASPQPLSGADRGGSGANPGSTCGHAYCSTRDGSASGNGGGGGTAAGKPCAGCVGKADNKDPRGQAVNGRDANNGYECDGNSGIARTNPAHTGCRATPPPPPPAPDCTTDPTRQGCPTPPGPDCTTDPTRQGCPTPPAPDCTTDPTRQGCPTPPGPDCTTDPTREGCPSGPGTTEVLPLSPLIQPLADLAPKASPRAATTAVLSRTAVSARPAALPFTGSGTDALLPAAVAALLAGAALVRAGRRRTA
jgi:hypothetical protein